jgi:hypothetical protein
MIAGLRARFSSARSVCMCALLVSASSCGARTGGLEETGGSGGNAASAGNAGSGNAGLGGAAGAGGSSSAGTSGNQSSGCPAGPPLQDSFCDGRNYCYRLRAGPPGCFYGSCNGIPGQLYACCDDSTWTVATFTECPADGCSAERDDLTVFAGLNRSCESDADCIRAVVACGAGPESCNGSFYVNRRMSSARLNQLAAALETCQKRAKIPCSVCDETAPPPACINRGCRDRR